MKIAHKIKSTELIFTFAMVCASLGASPAVERVYFNAKVYTASPDRPYAEAVAIRDDKIVSVGTRAQVLKTVGASAEQVDLQGKTLLPGFVDSHTHPISGGIERDSAHADETVETIQQLAKLATEAKQSGRGMRGDVLFISRVPLHFWTKNAELNTIFNAGLFATQPVLLVGSDGHTGWANHVFLNRAKVTKHFIAELSLAERAYYGHTPDFEPNGFAVERGLLNIVKFVPALDKETRVKGARAGLQYNNSLGITAWLDPRTNDPHFEAYKNLSESGELTAHVAALPVVDPRSDPEQELARVQELRRKFRSVRGLYIPGFKVYADGVAEFPSQSAAFLKPYRNSGRNGELLFDPARYKKLCIAADKLGLIVHVHAIGDLAVREALNGFEAARHANGNSGIPHTITHLQFIDPTDIPRFGELGAIAAFQLYWASANVDAIDLVKPYVDEKIFPWQYTARSVLDSGGTLAGASDWPVSTPNVFAAIYQAETRKGPLGVLNADQRVPCLAMLDAYTRNAARALGLEDRIGSITPGKQADMILLDRDVLTVTAEEMKDTKVLWTMFGGKIVYRASPK